MLNGPDAGGERLAALLRHLEPPGQGGGTVARRLGLALFRAHLANVRNAASTAVAQVLGPHRWAADRLRADLADYLRLLDEGAPPRWRGASGDDAEFLGAPAALLALGIIEAAAQKAAGSQPPEGDARFFLQQDSLPAPDARVGGTILSQRAYGLAWEEPGRGRRFLGFRTPEGGPTLAVLHAPGLDLEGRRRRAGPRDQVPLGPWLAERGFALGPEEVFTQELMDALQEKGYHTQLRPARAEEALPGGPPWRGSERHGPGACLLAGVRKAYPELQALRAALRDGVRTRTLGARDRLAETAARDAALQGSQDPAERAILGHLNLADLEEDFSTRLRLELDESQVELLLALRAYDGALEGVEHVPPDPFRTRLLVQLREDLAERGCAFRGEPAKADRHERRFAAGLHWLLQHAVAHHRAKFLNLPEPERYVACMQEAMGEAQALCASEGPGKAVAALYHRKGGKVGVSVGMDILYSPPGQGLTPPCLGEANRRDLANRFLIPLRPILRAAAEVDRLLKEVVADALTGLILADPGRFGLPERLNAAQVRGRAVLALDRARRAGAKASGVARLDAALEDLLALKPARPGGSPHLWPVLKGHALRGGTAAYHRAVARAREAFQLVAEIVSWQEVWHTRREDVLRQPAAAAALVAGSLRTLFPPKPAATLNGPVHPSSFHVFVPIREAGGEPRYVDLLAVPDPGANLHRLVPSPPMTEKEAFRHFHQGNALDGRFLALGAVLEDWDGNPPVPVAQVMAALGVPCLGEGRWLFHAHCPETPRIAWRLGLRLGGAWLPRLHPEGMLGAFPPGARAYPETFLATTGPGGRLRVEISGQGRQDLEGLLDDRIREAGFSAEERAVAEGYQAAILDHFEAVHQGMRVLQWKGLACLLPGGQALGPVPDLLSLLPYDPGEHPDSSGAEALGRLGGLRSLGLGCSMTYGVLGA